MKDSIRKYFKIGAVQWMSHPPDRCPLLSSVHTFAADDFFSVLEIQAIEDEKTKIEARELLAQAHMPVSCCGQTRLLNRFNPNSLDETEREHAEKTLLEGVDDAVFFNALSFEMMAGKWEPKYKEEAYRQLMKTTIAVCRYAAERNIPVEMEVFDYDMDKAVLIGPSLLAARFAEDVRKVCPNFSLLVDLSHIPPVRESIPTVVRTLRPYISHIHIGNAVVKEGCECYGDKHPRFGYPDSSIDVGELTEFFQQLKINGLFNEKQPMIMSIEIQPRTSENMDLVLAGAKRVIRQAWAFVQD